MPQGVDCLFCVWNPGSSGALHWGNSGKRDEALKHAAALASKVHTLFPNDCGSHEIGVEGLGKEVRERMPTRAPRQRAQCEESRLECFKTRSVERRRSQIKQWRPLKTKVNSDRHDRRRTLTRQTLTH